MLVILKGTGSYISLIALCPFNGSPKPETSGVPSNKNFTSKSVMASFCQPAVRCSRISSSVHGVNVEAVGAYKLKYGNPSNRYTIDVGITMATI